MYKLLITALFSCLAFSIHATTLMVQVNFDNDVHQIVDAWLVKQDLPANFHLKGRNDDIRFDLLDGNSQLISANYANRPAPIYGAFILATEQEKQQLNQQKLANKKGSYYLRIPNYQPKMRSIQLSYQPQVQLASTDKNQLNRSAKRITKRAYYLDNLTVK